MVFESADSWPSYEGQEREVPPPLSSYGFQKLAVEYFARAAHEQYGLPYTIVRPFNCVGIGEMRAQSEVEVLSGNVKLAMSHVVPDLVQKVVKGQDPLHILGDGQPGPALHLRRRPRPGHRHRDGAPGRAQRGLQPLDRGVHDRARARRAHLAPTQADRRAVPLRERRPVRARRAAARPVGREGQATSSGFEATTTLDEMLDEVVPWVVDAIGKGLI